jgi:S-adenosylmethionine synthetase
MTRPHTLTSESVTEGHPDKVADYISDAVLDAHIAGDHTARVACETIVKSDQVILVGEITSGATVDLDAVVRQAIRDAGYTDPEQPFCAETVTITTHLTAQEEEIAQGVGARSLADLAPEKLGAGDQGMMFGYATDETPELMPLPILLAHRLTRGLAEARKTGEVDWLQPDGKSQVSVEYDGDRPVRVSHVLVSTQHAPELSEDLGPLRQWVREVLIPRALGDWFDPRLEPQINPLGSFAHGGPAADSGLTGRKIIVDTYGGAAPHGGGAFSGKDPTKVDRSGAYFARWAARQAVEQGIAPRALVQVSYVIGQPEPMSVDVRTFGRGDEQSAWKLLGTFDFRPGAIIRQLDLLRPIYRGTANYGHFGRGGLRWES